ncbi:MAG: RNA methyltransferase [Anaerolineae bacterium]|nr:RNA methyltransferase [Anaerolineae bacterium]
MFEKITSFQNPRLKLIKKLRDKKEREREQRFVIDDTRDLERALVCGYRVDYCFYTPMLANGQFIPGLQKQQVYEVSPEMMEKVSYRANPGAFLAVMHDKPVRDYRQLSEIVDQPVLGMVNLQKPGNIGALLRTADATGFKGILLIDTLLDPYNPNIIRSSTGACFLDNIYYVSTVQAVDFFKQNHYQVLSAHLAGESNLFKVQMADRCAIILGTEDIGLDESWIQHSDELVKIPMMGELSDSLNVSVSGAIFMYEALRQRLAHRV